MDLQYYERDHIAKLRQQAAECTLFLKTNGDFPLGRPGKLALFGNGAEFTVKGGTGSGDVNSRFYTTAMAGLKEAGFTITTEMWLSGYAVAKEECDAAFHNKLKEQMAEGGLGAFLSSIGIIPPEPDFRIPLASDADTAVYVLARNSGEGFDRSYREGDLLLTGTEIRDILEMVRIYPRSLLVLNTGGLVDLSPVAEKVPNILLLSQLGVVTGSILADILLGEANPSGKLAMTWAREHDYPTDGAFGHHRTNRYAEGIYVGYRYFSTARITPLFPFGFGLSYTDFRLKTTAVCAEGTEISCAVSVRNVGSYAGKEVVQLYLSKPQGRLGAPALELAAYKKTKLLAPHEEEQLNVCFDLRDMASYDAGQSAWVLEAGDYTVSAGNASHTAKPVCVLRLQEDAVVRHAAAVGGTTEFTDWRPQNVDLPRGKDLPVLPVTVRQNDSKEPSHPANAVEELAEAMTDEELALVCIGAYAKDKATAMIGNAAFSVIGAAGETTLALKDKLPRSLVMADGPAGLRLAQQYGEDENGVYALSNPFLESLLRDLIPADVAAAAGLDKKPPERNGIIKTQYCTAIPIGTAIAQSFNEDFAALCGEIVGDEMERFGVHLWLAPALNIQRDPRCGRNFEYYSEDPLLSGMMAAAITRGVQSHAGCGTTIKHFCCNNQEHNRTRNDSQVSERALREIYTKGFGICIRRAQPKAVMTSYNLLNGIHTAERRDLNTELLRNEFGFEGIVMTDWIGTERETPEGEYRVGSAPETIASGNDLCMPGSQSDLDAILAALENGTLTRNDLLLSASRIIRMICSLNDAGSRNRHSRS